MEKMQRRSLTHVLWLTFVCVCHAQYDSEDHKPSVVVNKSLHETTVVSGGTTAVFSVRLQLKTEFESAFIWRVETPERLDDYGDVVEPQVRTELYVCDFEQYLPVQSRTVPLNETSEKLLKCWVPFKGEIAPQFRERISGTTRYKPDNVTGLFTLVMLLRDIREKDEGCNISLRYRMKDLARTTIQISDVSLFADSAPFIDPQAAYALIIVAAVVVAIAFMCVLRFWVKRMLLTPTLRDPVIVSRVEDGTQRKKTVFRAGPQRKKTSFQAGPQRKKTVFQAGPQRKNTSFQAGPQRKTTGFQAGPSAPPPKLAPKPPQKLNMTA